LASPRTHFISVARNGDLHARRVGAAPVRIAAAGQPLALTVPDRPELAYLRIYFEHAPATPRHHVHVTTVELAGVRLPLATFQSEHHVSDAELGQWMRAAIDRLLDVS
jgi:hypothetical protein